MPSVTIGNDQWKIAGCPVNGPAMDIFQETLAVAWFTGVNDEGKVNLVFSENNRESFGTPIRIDNGNATGRVDMAMLSESEAAVLWMEPMGEDEVIQLVRVTINGEIGNPITISKTIPERASGFPQLEKVGDSLYIAWTGVLKKDTYQIKMAKVAINKL